MPPPEPRLVEPYDDALRELAALSLAAIRGEPVPPGADERTARRVAVVIQAIVDGAEASP